MQHLQEIQPRELAYGDRLRYWAVAAPLLLTLLPAVITFLLLMFAVSDTPAAAVTLFFGLVAMGIGFVAGIIIAVTLARKRSLWSREMRERIAARGIKADQIDWFRNELKSTEKHALKAVEARNLLLADAYRETLASRLTATRIVRSSRQELILSKRRQGTVRQLKGQRADDFQRQIEEDIAKIEKISDESKLMLAEAESRLQMIEAAASRGGTLAEHEIALKKLNSRAVELPLALETARLAEEIRHELENEDSN